MNIEISKVVERMAPSGIRAFFDLVLGMKDVISLGVGEPDFVTPWNIREKGIYALEQGFTSYTSNKGLVELRKGLSHFLRYKRGLVYNPDEEMLITVGVSEGLDLAMRALLNPKDKVLIPQPCYVSYAPTVELAGGIPVFLQTEIKDHFKITPELIEKTITKDVKAMVINYPCNPTGASYTKKELQAIANVAMKHNLIILSDEVYDDLTYDFEHTPFASLKGMKNHVVYLNGFSKIYAMTGFRIGWVCGPAKIVAAMTKIHQYTILCAPIVGQMAAVEALSRNSDESVQYMRREYKRRRNYIVSALNDIGLSCHCPQGAFYVFPSIKNTGMTSMDFATKLLKQQKVALVPGTAFGDFCEGYVRISYASGYDDLKEAIERIKKFLKKV